MSSGSEVEGDDGEQIEVDVPAIQVVVTAQDDSRVQDVSVESESTDDN